MTQQTEAATNIAAIIACLQPGENQGRMMRNLFARNVELYLSETSTKNQHFAAESAHRVTSVKDAGTSDAYCLTVPDFGCFMVGGVAVSNCDATTYPIVYEMPVVKPIVDVKIKFSW